jgi:hypothetical protein
MWFWSLGMAEYRQTMKPREVDGGPQYVVHSTTWKVAGLRKDSTVCEVSLPKIEAQR